MLASTPALGRASTSPRSPPPVATTASRCWRSPRASGPTRSTPPSPPAARAIGENYAQELVAKRDARRHGAEVHFIGQLQTNKVRQVAGLVDVYETVDRQRLAAEIAKRRRARRA